MEFHIVDYCIAYVFAEYNQDHVGMFDRAIVGASTVVPQA